MTNSRIDFSAVLASSVHDMKNSLSLLLQSIDKLGKNIEQDHPEASRELADIHYEASRLNSGLVQLLSVYRAEIEHMPLNIDEHYVIDVVEDLLTAHSMYSRDKGIEVSLNIDNDLEWCMDADLVAAVLTDILVNAMRYTRDKIVISANIDEDTLVLRIEDNGPGYPELMLQSEETSMAELDVRHGRTGLGLFFAQMIAQAHERNGERGRISLQNGGMLGGSVFTIKLP